jgi:hypothetical protein
MAVTCAEPEKARGLCQRHYTAARVAGLLRPSFAEGCAYYACDRPVSFRGWCRRHYDHVRQYGRPTPDREHKRAVGQCARGGCRKKAVARGRCQTHYHAWWKQGGGWRVVMKVAKKRARVV